MSINRVLKFPKLKDKICADSKTLYLHKCTTPLFKLALIQMYIGGSYGVYTESSIAEVADL